ncbi:hypothetical protein CR513_33578, partial [Mucuna pruriens]
MDQEKNQEQQQKKNEGEKEAGEVGKHLVNLPLEGPPKSCSVIEGSESCMLRWGKGQIDHHALNSWNPDGILLSADMAIHLEDKEKMNHRKEKIGHREKLWLPYQCWLFRIFLTFILESNASSKGIGVIKAVLLQEGKSIAFMSQTLSERAQRKLV